jgi:hypothetical protein
MSGAAIRAAWALGAGFLVAAARAQAQDPRVEIGASAGFTLSDGVTFQGVIGGDGNVYNEIGPKDSVCFGANLGFFVSESTEVGFLWGRQQTTLEVLGTTTREVGDQNVDNYHGYVAYHFGDPEARARFYVLGGAGATRYGSVPFQVGSFVGETAGETQFSTTWGLGVKLYPAPRFGIKLGARWTPTYIKSDSEGWWCDPYWGCYVLSDAQYSNQFELAGGIVVRF